MAQPGPAKSTYARWIRDRTVSDRSSGQTLDAVNQTLPGLESLRDYFVNLPVNSLAGCWVACIVDGVAFDLDSPARLVLGDLARALIVVAERLHGVSLPQEVLLMPTANEVRPKAQPMNRPDSCVSPSSSSLAPTAAPAPAGAGWSVDADGPLPLPKRRGSDPALMAAIIALGPLPQRLRLKAKQFTSFKVAKLIKDAQAMGGPKDLQTFLAADGEYRIVHRAAAK